MRGKTEITLTGHFSNEGLSFSRLHQAAQIVVIRGPDVGASFRVKEKLLIGSGSHCDAVLADKTVSREHLEVRWDGRTLTLRDLGSKNGSFAAGEPFVEIELGFGEVFLTGKTGWKIFPVSEAVDPVPFEEAGFGAMKGDSPVMRQLFTMVSDVAPSQAPVLIEGETGVGKELVAEELHRCSKRKDKPFIVFDCGSVPEQLIESTLFGHVKGAFTGADRDRRGVFQEADGGTIFLDEIGELRLELQPALLRVLDRGMVRRVGATRYEDVNVRIVAATHRNLTEAVDAGAFREDLYYRLAVVRMGVPPLRDRPVDVPILAREFLRRAGRPEIDIDEEDMKSLQALPWPGNVRQLRNVIERAVVMTKGTVLDLKRAMASTPSRAASSAAPAGPAASGGAGPRLLFKDAKAQVVEDFEKKYLSDLIGEFDTLSGAADAAGMDRRHLRTLLKRHGLA